MFAAKNHGRRRILENRISIRFQAQSNGWHPRLEKLWVSQDSENDRVLAELNMHDPEIEQIGLVAWPTKM